MSLFKRTPLAPISENIDQNFRVQSRSNSALKIFHRGLECQEELNFQNDTCESEYYKQKSFWEVEFRHTSQRYTLELYREIVDAESRLCGLSLYLNTDGPITPSIRSTLVEWMADVSHGCQHMPETLFMAVNYLDRYLSINPVPLQRLQLIGVTCLYLSAKLNDIAVPQIDEYSYVTEYSYTTDDIIDAEREILTALEFNLVVPTLIFFAELYFSYFNDPKIDDNCPLLLATLCEYTLIDYFVTNSYYPSIIAAAVLLFSSFHCERDLNIQELSVFGLDVHKINSCFSSLTEFLSSNHNCACPSSTSRFTSVWQFKQ